MLRPVPYAAVVLAGGTARRMGGGDKTALELHAGRTVLDHLVGGLDPRVCVVVVGPPRPLERLVLWTREDPPGGGPAAALVAGAALARARSGARWILALAGDQPYAAAALPLLLAAVTQPGDPPESMPDVVLARDAGGRDQPLLALYRATALPESVSAGTSVRSLLDGLQLRRVDVPAQASLDIDTPADLARARLDPPG